MRVFPYNSVQLVFVKIHINIFAIHKLLFSERLIRMNFLQQCKSSVWRALCSARPNSPSSCPASVSHTNTKYWARICEKTIMAGSFERMPPVRFSQGTMERIASSLKATFCIEVFFRNFRLFSMTSRSQFPG